MDNYVRHAWIGIEGSAVEVPAHVDPIAFVMERAEAFGLSQDDMHLWKHGNHDDEDLQLAMMDRILGIGCGGMPGTNVDHPEFDMPVILIEISVRNRIIRGAGGATLLPENDPRVKTNGMAIAVFQRESWPSNRRLRKFLHDSLNGELGITRKMDILMKEWGSQRQWPEYSESIIKGYNITEGQKAVCFECKNTMSWDELVHLRKCSRCGTELA